MLTRTQLRASGTSARPPVGLASWRGTRPVSARVPRVAHIEAGETSEQLDMPSDVLVKIAVPFKTTVGKSLKAVGASKKLGEWDAKVAPSLHWTDGDIWVGEVALPPGAYEFKVVVWDSTAARAEWENCRNRLLQVPAFPGTLEARCTWSKSEMTTHFTDLPRETHDPIEDAAQQAALHTAALTASPEAAEHANSTLQATRRSIQDTVAALMTEEDMLSDELLVGRTPEPLIDPVSPAGDAFATFEAEADHAIIPLDLTAAAQEAHTAAVIAAHQGSEEVAPLELPIEPVVVVEAVAAVAVQEEEEEVPAVEQQVEEKEEEEVVPPVGEVVAVAADTTLLEEGREWDSTGEEAAPSVVGVEAGLVSHQLSGAVTDDEPADLPPPPVVVPDTPAAPTAVAHTPSEQSVEEEELAAQLAAELLADLTPEATTDVSPLAVPPSTAEVAAADLQTITAAVAVPPAPGHTVTAPPALPPVGEEVGPDEGTAPRAKVTRGKGGKKRQPGGLRGFFDMLKGHGRE